MVTARKKKTNPQPQRRRSPAEDPRQNLTEKRLQQLEAGYTHLANITDKNISAFVESLQFLEAMSQVFKLVLNDLARGAAVLSTSSGSKDIDFGHYMKSYLEFVAAQAKSEPSRLVSANDDSPIIFGGA